MKISTFKVPIKLTREANGINLEVKEDEKTLSKEQPLGEEADNEIVKLSKQVSDYNEKQKSIAKAMMLKGEDEREGFIFMQFLT